jgi:hypothetical protein
MKPLLCNSMRVYGNGHQPRQPVSSPPLKFVDTFNININVPATGIVLPGIVSVPQGAGVSNRVGNKLSLHQLFFNYNITQINTDVVTQVRVLTVQFFPPSSLIMPIIQDFLQTLNNVQSMYAWDTSNQYIILSDDIHFLSGTATNPTSSSNVGFYGEIDISKARKTLEFTSTSPLGSNQLYTIVISDSLVAPFPVFDSTIRLVYRD